MFSCLLNRLEEKPGSKWKPQLSSFQFQTLLQNLTAVKIRATFGENGEVLPLFLCYDLYSLSQHIAFLKSCLRPLKDELLFRSRVPGQRASPVCSAWKRRPSPLGSDVQLSTGIRGRVLRAVLSGLQTQEPCRRSLQPL